MADSGTVQVDEATLRKLDLADAARGVTTGNLDRFPALIMDTCVGGSVSPLVASIIARFSAGSPVPTETLTMPKRGFSPRPVTIMDPAARTLYTALVAKLAEAVPSTRTSDDWERHEKFGNTEGDPFAEYLVEFDIASCYEYIDHGRLREELLLRTLEVRYVQLCTDFLGAIYGSRRGLPQLSRTSDILADTYLQVVERALLRDDNYVSRFADDFKVETWSWEVATKVIEDAAEHARGLGLILASEKTHIWKASTLASRRVAAAEFLQKYFAEATTALTTIDFLAGGYGTDVVEVPPEQEATVREALRRIFEDWHRDQPASDTTSHAQFLPAALAILPAAVDRVPDAWLTELVFRQPMRLEGVCNYLLARPDGDANWKTLVELAGMKRQSPWAKIWLLHVARAQSRVKPLSMATFDTWAQQQLGDRHEVVRAEAAWYLASSARAMNETALAGLYREASSMTRPALAACCGAARLSEQASLVKALHKDGKLTQAGYAYGAQFADTL